MIGIESVRRQAAITFPASYRPAVGSCVTSIRDCGLAPSYAAFIAQESETIAKDRLAHVPPGVPSLSLDAATALSAYSFDLRACFMSDDVKENFYVQLNTALHDRAHFGGPLSKLRPYLYFLFEAWRSLTAVPGGTKVYRGVGASAASAIEAAYRQGTDVFWSTWVSTSLDLTIAEGFASEEGPGGVVFEILTVTGRRVDAYSAIPSESEVLLSPNSEFIVTAGLHAVAGKVYRLVVLTEKAPGGSSTTY